ncbi:restriction endonuclease subunit S [Methanobrevibacter smithii]|uniref:restriction endonuclease subunit S n=1 Tax=Methanobrevibacter smithii TaxID=2173 RepID=UPI0037DC9B53
MSLVLNDVAKFISSKIEVSEINVSNYISTENMLPNKGGITTASSLPDTKSVREYIPKDILINNIRPYFKKIWYSDMEGGCSNDIYVLRFNENYDSKFLYYVLSSDDFFSYVMANAKGTKMPRGDKKAIQNYKVPNFSIDKQKKISSFLGEIDRKIEINKKLNKNLQKQINILFKSFFINFEFYDGKYQETLFGEIPIEWNIILFKDILNERNEKSTNQDIPMYSVTLDGIQPRADIYKKKITAKTTKFKIIHKYDLIFGMPNSGYQYGIMYDEIGGVSSAYPVFEINGIQPRYVDLFIKNISNYFNDIVKSGSRMGQGIDKKVLLSKEIYVPPNEHLDKYYSIESKLLDLINHNLTEINNLTKLRDTLLPKLMSGEIDVSKINCDLELKYNYMKYLFNQIHTPMSKSVV